MYDMWHKCIVHNKLKDRSCTANNACKLYFKLWLTCTNSYLEHGYREDPRDF